MIGADPRVTLGECSPVVRRLNDTEVRSRLTRGHSHGRLPQARGRPAASVRRAGYRSGRRGRPRVGARIDGPSPPCDGRAARETRRAVGRGGEGGPRPRAFPPRMDARRPEGSGRRRARAGLQRQLVRRLPQPRRAGRGRAGEQERRHSDEHGPGELPVVAIGPCCEGRPWGATARRPERPGCAVRQRPERRAPPLRDRLRLRPMAGRPAQGDRIPGPSGRRAAASPGPRRRSVWPAPSWPPPGSATPSPPRGARSSGASAIPRPCSAPA